MISTNLCEMPLPKKHNIKHTLDRNHEVMLGDVRNDFLKAVKKNFGGAGYRSRYLSHAKRALYHLSYAPVVKCFARQNNYKFQICNTREEIKHQINNTKHIQVLAQSKTI